MNTKKDVSKRMDYARKELLPEVEKILISDFGKKQEYHGDYTIPTDEKADKKCIEKIQEKYPNDAIVSEESFKQGKYIKGDEFEWVIDPLDGTMNYNNKNPNFVVSIALKKDGKTRGGIIYHPLSKKLYSAESGRGAYLNSKPIKVSSNGRLGEFKISLVHDLCFSKFNEEALMKRLEDKIKNTEKLGCTALELAYVADGTFAGIVKLSDNPWGVSAGLFIIAEAGGIITPFKKGKATIYVASNRHIHDNLCRIVDEYLSINAA